jgi:hypothetical protein
MTFEQLRDWRNDEAAKSTEEKFMGKPESWFVNLHWFCTNGHVSGVFLKTDTGDRCLACREMVLMGPAIGEAEFAKVVAAWDKFALRTS